MYLVLSLRLLMIYSTVLRRVVVTLAAVDSRKAMICILLLCCENTLPRPLRGLDMLLIYSYFRLL